MATDGKRIHFGDWLRFAVDDAGGPTHVHRSGVVSLASIMKWSKAATPDEARITRSSLAKVARLLKFASVDAMNSAWTSTPVPAYQGRRDPESWVTCHLKLSPEEMHRVFADGRRPSTNDDFVLAYLTAPLVLKWLDGASIEDVASVSNHASTVLTDASSNAPLPIRPPSHVGKRRAAEVAKPKGETHGDLLKHPKK